MARSPINRHALSYSNMHNGRLLAIKDREAHVAIYGNKRAGRSEHAFAIAEEVILEDREKVVVISTHPGWYGLAVRRDGKTAFSTDRELISFGRDIHGFTIDDRDGAALAQIAIKGDASIVCGVQHIMDRQRIGRFLQAFFARLVEEEDLQITLVLDILQALHPRRRHGYDGAAVSALQTIMEMSYNTGIKIVLTASSPNEIPIEFRNGFATKILCRATDINQLRAIASVTHPNISDPELSTIDGIGLAYRADNDHWIVPGEHVHPDVMLCSPLPELKSGAGPRGGVRVPATPLQIETIQKIVDARPKDEDGDAAPAARSRSRRRSTKHARRGSGTLYTLPNGGLSIRGKAAALKLPHAAHQLDLGRKILSIRRNGEIVRHEINDSDELLDLLKNETLIGESARISHMACKPLKGIAPGGIVGLAHYQAAKIDKDSADAFFCEAIRSPDIISEAIPANADPNQILRSILTTFSKAKGVPLEAVNDDRRMRSVG